MITLQSGFVYVQENGFGSAIAETRKYSGIYVAALPHQLYYNIPRLNERGKRQRSFEDSWRDIMGLPDCRLISDGLNSFCRYAETPLD